MVRMRFSSSFLSSIVIHSAKEEEEGGEDGLLEDPMDEDLPTTALVSTESAIAAPPEGMSALQSVIQAPSEGQGIALTDII